jgi:hypothetical protein
VHVLDRQSDPSVRVRTAYRFIDLREPAFRDLGDMIDGQPSGGVLVRGFARGDRHPSIGRN